MDPGQRNSAQACVKGDRDHKQEAFKDSILEYILDHDSHEKMIDKTRDGMDFFQFTNPFFILEVLIDILFWQMEKGETQKKKNKNRFFQMDCCFIGMREEMEEEVGDGDSCPEGYDSVSPGFWSEFKVLTEIV